MVLALAAVAAGVWWGNRTLEQRLYPFRYREEILTYSKQNGLDPMFVASIIRNESRFNPDAVSNKGAIGLMQIMPNTGKWVAKQMGFSGFDPEMLRDPATNIKIGTWYLAELKKEFGGKVVLVVAAYNAGRGRVRNWATKSGWDPKQSVAAELVPWPGKDAGEDFPVASITIRETRNYVRGVLASLSRYRRIYSDVLEANSSRP